MFMARKVILFTGSCKAGAVLAASAVSAAASGPNLDVGAFHATQLLNEPALVSLANQTVNGDGLVVPYVGVARTTKETTMKLMAIASRSAFTIDHDEWISCSHWGMFPVRQKSSNSRGEA
jgi:hypothetical protein